MKPGIYKFVRVELPENAGIELRFFSMDIEHKSQVLDAERALGAGLLVVMKGGWRYLNQVSYSLNISATRDCDKMITETLGVERLKARAEG